MSSNVQIAFGCRHIFELHGIRFENKLLASVRDISRIVTKSKSRDKKQQGKYNEMIKTLMEEYGYDEASATEVIKYASNNLWRDS